MRRLGYLLVAVIALTIASVTVAIVPASATTTYVIGKTYKVKPDSKDGWRDTHNAFDAKHTCSTNTVGYHMGVYLKQVGFGSVYVDRISAEMTHPAQTWYLSKDASAIEFNALKSGKRYGRPLNHFGTNTATEFRNGTDTKYILPIHYNIRLSPEKYNFRINLKFYDINPGRGHRVCIVRAIAQYNMAS